MNTSTPQSQKIQSMVINFPTVDLKKLKDIAKAMGWVLEKNEYFESAQFYKDVDDAEKAIANGEGRKINNLEELNDLFA